MSLFNISISRRLKAYEKTLVKYLNQNINEESFKISPPNPDFKGKVIQYLPTLDDMNYDASLIELNIVYITVKDAVVKLFKKKQSTDCHDHCDLIPVPPWQNRCQGGLLYIENQL